MWNTSADPSGIGYTPNKLPLETQRALGGVLGVNIQKSGEAVKGLDRLAPTLVHVCRFIWEWTYAKSKSHINTPGGIGGGGRGGVTNSKVSGSCQTAQPIGTEFGTRRWIRLGMDIG